MLNIFETLYPNNETGNFIEELDSLNVATPSSITEDGIITPKLSESSLRFTVSLSRS